MCPESADMNRSWGLWSRWCQRMLGWHRLDGVWRHLLFTGSYWENEGWRSAGSLWGRPDPEITLRKGVTAAILKLEGNLPKNQGGVDYVHHDGAESREPGLHQVGGGGAGTSSCREMATSLAWKKSQELDFIKALWSDVTVQVPDFQCELFCESLVGRSGAPTTDTGAASRAGPSWGPQRPCRGEAKAGCQVPERSGVVQILWQRRKVMENPWLIERTSGLLARVNTQSRRWANRKLWATVRHVNMVLCICFTPSDGLRSCVSRTVSMSLESVQSHPKASANPQGGPPNSSIVCWIDWSGNPMSLHVSAHSGRLHMQAWQKPQESPNTCDQISLPCFTWK